MRLSLVSNAKPKTEMKEGPDSHCLIKCKLHVALGLTHALGSAGCPTFDLMHAKVTGETLENFREDM